MVVVLNKCDLLPPHVTAAWRQYLADTLHVPVVPFSASAAQLAHDGSEGLAARRREIVGARKRFSASYVSRRLEFTRELLAACDGLAAWPDIQANIRGASGSGRLAGGLDSDTDEEGASMPPAARKGKYCKSKGRKGKRGARKPAAPASDSEDSMGHGAAGKRNAAADERAAELEALLHQLVDESSSDIDDDTSSDAADGAPSGSAGFRVAASPSVVQAPPAAASAAPGKPIVLGMIGHPNVGKSSLINCLAGQKVVSVSRTPGHTKRTQTLPLSPALTLLDCPGVVLPHGYGPGRPDAEVPPFPAAEIEAAAGPGASEASRLPCLLRAAVAAGPPGSSPALTATCALSEPALGVATQQACGVVPLAQVREPYTAIRFLASVLPLEKLYGLTTQIESDVLDYGEYDVSSDPGLTPWSPHAFCEGLARKSGTFIARTGQPDAHAAGRRVLYDSVDGIIPLWWMPPGAG